MRDFEIVLGLLLTATLVQPIARRLDVPLAVAQIVFGMLLSAVPLLSVVSFDPDLIFTLLVPPLLYRAAASSSLRDTRREARPILLLAVALVLVTAVTVAASIRLVVPALSWPAALVLGTMVSPSDAEITTTIARRLGLPVQLVTILEGETLLNDATAFVSYRMAVAAVVIGTFSLAQASLTFLVQVAGGAAVGLGFGWLVAQLRRRLSDSISESTISLLTPFAAYLLAERVGTSGVLAVVITGFYVSRFLPRTVSPRARVRALMMWEIVTFMVGGFIFLLLGLQLGRQIGALWRSADRSVLQVIAVATFAVIATRFLWVFASSYVSRLLARTDRLPADLGDWRKLFIVSWAGLRGGDTLVMALAVPLTTVTGVPFPGRELITTCALGVVFATITIHGLTLRPIIRWLKIPPDTSTQQEERHARLAAAQASLTELAEVARRQQLPKQVTDDLQAGVQRSTRLDLDDIDHAGGHDGQSPADVLRNVSQSMRDAARSAVVRLRDDDVISDQAMHRVIADLDLDDLRNADTDAL